MSDPFPETGRPYVRFRTMDPLPLSKQFRIAREGKGWLAVAPGFCNLECSPFGFALTRDMAIEQLLGGVDYRRLERSQAWRRPSAADFVEVDVIDEDAPEARAAVPAPRLVVSR
jgi:hypothetical protein